MAELSSLAAGAALKLAASRTTEVEIKIAERVIRGAEAPPELVWGFFILVLRIGG
jgi:hypothetical protein